jgi:hypothetical protein
LFFSLCSFFLLSFFIAENFIHDEGAKRIAKSLKVNQSLLHLNLGCMLFLFLLFQNPFNILLLQLTPFFVFFFFDLEALNWLTVEGVVDILKANKILKTLVLSSEDNAKFQFHLFVCLSGDSNTHFFFPFSCCRIPNW